ncbi:MAG: transcriptional regulator [Clostridia bacterium]|nr:transcriptional regulator [Clostridia bacterium]
MQERFKNFTVLMTRITRSIRRLKTEEMKKWGLKSHHVSCLYYLYKNDSLTATELGEICEEDKASLSRAIESLEEDGYIVCNSKTQKRYRSPLVLTEKGREAGKRISDKVDEVLKSTAMGVSEEERETMYRALECVCLSLEKLCNEFND